MFRIKLALLAAFLLGWGQAAAIAQSENENSDEGPIGWASEDGGTTGGAGGEVVTVTSGGDLKNHAGSSDPKIIKVSGEIRTGISIGSNTTIEGEAPGAVIGCISMSGVQNIILRNLVIQNSGSSDLISVSGTQHVWIDHCELIDASDGILDLSRGCDLWTISWTKIRYTYNDKGHRFAFLFGTNDSDGGSDRGKLRITMHHNWWAENVHERMPRVRFGQVHVFNSYFSSEGNNYCIRAAIESKLVVENNYFDNVTDPHEFYTDDAEMVASGNVYIGIADATKKETRGEAFVPPYEYTMEPGATVKETVMQGAGPFNKAEVVNVILCPPPKAASQADFFSVNTGGYDAAGRFDDGARRGKLLRITK